MAQMSDTRKKAESSFMNDYWSFRKQIGEPENSDAYWDFVVNGINQLEERHKEPYFQNILMDCVFDLEIRARGIESKYATDTDERWLRAINKARGKRGLRELIYKE